MSIKGIANNSIVRKTVLAAVSGSIIEWYDLFLYGSLVVILSNVFFPSHDPVLSLFYSIAAFVAGAAVRPIGGIIFGRMGDLVGRKYAFFLTVTIMGIGTVMIGLLPPYGQIGILAPLILVLLRIMQGLAVGGEYGGAAIYIAENIEDDKRGYWTSYIQATATLGLLLSSTIVLLTRLHMSQTEFHDWGWRVPFLLSFPLLVLAIVIRWRLRETKLFSMLLDKDRTSKHPLKESLTDKKNLRPLLLALLAVSGASVVWHTSQFYTSIFMQGILKIDFVPTSLVMLTAISLGAPFFVFFGWLSDKIGRVKLLLSGNILAAVTYYPLYMGMKFFSDPLNIPVLTGLVFTQIFFSAMCYGPLAAFLVERFSARIRYTSLSLAYGVGTGDIGDATLLIVPAIALVTGNIYGGLAWSIVVPIVISLLVVFFIKETKVSIWSEVNE